MTNATNIKRRKRMAGGTKNNMSGKLVHKDWVNLIHYGAPLLLLFPPTSDKKQKHLPTNPKLNTHLIKTCKQLCHKAELEN